MKNRYIHYKCGKLSGYRTCCILMFCLFPRFSWWFIGKTYDKRFNHWPCIICRYARKPYSYSSKNTEQIIMLLNSQEGQKTSTD